MKKLRGNIMLLFASIIWGSTFVAQSIGSKSLSAFTFNASRSLVAGIFLMPYLYIFGRIKHRIPKEDHTDNKKLLAAGISCGVVLYIASALQQIGISNTGAGKTGFITTMYILFVPIIGIFLGKKVHFVVWIGVAVSAAGLYLLCIKSGFVVSRDDLYLILCAVFYSFHILLIDHFSKFVNSVKMSCLQFFVAGILSLITAFIFEKPNFTAILSCALPILYAGVFSSGIAYTLQIIAQKDVNPTAASLIMSMESVFAALSGFIFLQERLSFKETIGSALVFCAIIIAQIPDMIKCRENI